MPGNVHIKAINTRTALHLVRRDRIRLTGNGLHTTTQVYGITLVGLTADNSCSLPTSYAPKSYSQLTINRGSSRAFTNKFVPGILCQVRPAARFGGVRHELNAGCVTAGWNPS